MKRYTRERCALPLADANLRVYQCEEGIMSFKIKNEYGTITISSEVIARVAGMTAMECYGIVGMAAKNVRDGLVHLLKLESLAKGVRITPKDKGLSIGLHIIVEYGTNIHAITETLASNVKYTVEDCVGLPVREVNIFVEGVRVD
jgi:uncharacterized alkaline shock family protein YloU